MNRTRIYHRCRAMTALLYKVALVTAFVGCLQRLPFWLNGTETRLLWPVSWLTLFPFNFGCGLIVVLSLSGVAAGAARPHSKWARVAAFLGLLQLAGFDSSFGHIGHQWHTWLAATFVLTWLPETDGESREQKECYILVCWGAMLLTLWTYTLAGFWKLVFGLGQVWFGQTSMFHPDALPIHVADQVLKKGKSGWLTDIVMSGASSGVLYVSVVSFEFLSALVAFRPGFHRIWGVGLIGLHMGIFLVMNILFWQAMLLCWVLLVRSPFDPTVTETRNDFLHPQEQSEDMFSLPG